MRFHRPVVLDPGVTEIADLLQHSSHEGGAEFLSDGKDFVAVFVSDILPTPCIVVERWESIQELTATLHVPTRERGVVGGGGVTTEESTS